MQKKKLLSSAALVMCLASGLLAAASLGGILYIPQYVTDAVANSSRPDKDRERDVNRKPAMVISFAGIKPGQKVAELMPGGGYFTRIFCQIIGPKGHLYTIGMIPTVKRDPPPPDAGTAAPMPGACTNVSADSQSAADFKLPGDLDVVWTSENYHDLHNAFFGKPDMAAYDRVIFDALKPGGVFIVEDHVAAAGSGARDTDTLHRIDPELVKQEVTSVGFVFDGASELLHNADDPHDAKVFELKGRSDKFLFKFRKPTAAQAAMKSAPAAASVTVTPSAPAAVAAADTRHAGIRRLTGQRILGEPGSADLVLQLTTADGDVQFAVSRADLKNLASLAGRYSQEK
jgi:predicted methyltransferase